MTGFDNQGYQYNTKYEMLLSRYGRPHERRDVQGLDYAEKGYSLAGSSADYLPRIQKDLTDFVLHQPAELWPGDKRQLVLKQIAKLKSTSDVYAIIDQLDPDTDTDTGSGSGSGRE